MRRFIPCALLLGAVQGDGDQFIPEGGKSLEQVYGPVAGVDETVPWYDRELSRAALPRNYFDGRSGDNCTFPIELYIVQDETASFKNNFDQMKNEELKKAFDSISSTHPGSTFGVGTHRDIPIWSLGEPRTDYCWAFHLPLSSNWTALYDTYDKLRPIGGGDAPEYQFGAIIAAAQSDKPGWRNPLATRVILGATDAQPHFEGDGFNKYGLKPYSRDGFDEAHADEQCRTQYYPPPSQVRDALKVRKAYLAMLIFDGEYNQGGKPIDAWRWFNSYIGQSPEFVANVEVGATNFWEQLLTVIQKLEDMECLPPTTTAPPTTATVLPTTATELSTTVTATTVSETETTTTATTVSETETITTATTSTETETPPTVPETTTTASTATETETTPTIPETTTTVTETETPPTVPETPTTATIVTETETPTTATNVTETETMATTVSETAPTAEPEGTTEPECPPCQEPDNCPCPAVKIALQDKPVYLKLVVNNTEA